MKDVHLRRFFLGGWHVPRTLGSVIHRFGSVVWVVHTRKELGAESLPSLPSNISSLLPPVVSALSIFSSLLLVLLLSFFPSSPFLSNPWDQYIVMSKQESASFPVFLCIFFSACRCSDGAPRVLVKGQQRETERLSKRHHRSFGYKSASKPPQKPGGAGGDCIGSKLYRYSLPL